MKLSFKLISVLVVIISTIFGIYGYYELKKNEENMLQETARTHELLIQNAYLVLGRALWDLNEDQQKNGLMQIFASENVTRAAIIENTGVVSLAMEKTNLLEQKESLKTFANNEALYPIESNNDEKLFPKNIFSYLPEKNWEEPFLKYDENFKNMIHTFLFEEKRLLAVPLFVEHNNEKALSGHFFVEYSVSNVYEKIKESKNSLIKIILFISISVIFSVFILFKFIILNRVFILQSASKKIAAGEYIKINTKGKDELSELSEHFNHMSERIAENIQNLKFISQYGLYIASSTTLSDLQDRLENVFEKIDQKDIPMSLFITQSLKDKIDGIHSQESLDSTTVYYQVKGDQEDLLPKDVQMLYESIIPLKSVKSNAVIGFLGFELKKASPKDRILAILEALSVNILSALENIEYILQQQEQTRMKAELETAKLVQSSLIPQSSHIIFNKCVIAGSFEPASEVGGDWWYYYPLHDNRILVLLGDVTGHGTSSALVTASVKGYCDSIYWRDHARPSDILHELDIVVRNSSDGSRLMTMYAVLLDPNNDIMYVSNAGHNAPFLINDENKVQRVMLIGKRLGFKNEHSSTENTKKERFKEKEFEFSEGTTIVIFSDGIVEARNDQDVEYGEKRLRKLIEESTHLDPLALREKILLDFKTFLNGVPHNDDVTLCICKHLKNDEISLYIPEMKKYVTDSRLEKKS